jgi:HSP20 family protein
MRSYDNFWPMDSFFNAALQTTRARQAVHDVEETESGFLLSLDLPGVPREKLGVEVKEGLLYVTAERPARAPAGPVPFEKVFSLPKGVDVDRIEARYRDGVLEIALPKREAAKPKAIEIKAA